MHLKVYQYDKCGTCRKALKFLAAQQIEFISILIRELPPTKKELASMLRFCGNIRRLFNTSGRDYRELNLKDRLPKMTADEAIELLSKNGNLVKRPFVLTDKFGLVGFDETAWKKIIR